MPNLHQSPALRAALGLPASPTPIDAKADGETMSQPEARLSRQIRTELQKRGAWGFKIHGGPTMMVGLPDLIFCYRGRFVALEVKMPEGVVSKIQRRRIAEIREAGGHAYVVRSVASAVRVLERVDRDVDTLPLSLVQKP
jgi:hypothetical protein